LLLAVMVLHVLTTHLGMFWDAGVYARVLHDWLNGRDPYSLSFSSLLFIYPPVFHWVSGFLVRFLQDIQAGGCKSLFIAGVRSRCLSCLLAFICAVCGWACLLPIYCLPCSSICRPGSAASRKYLRYLLLHRFDRCVAGNEKKPVGAILYNRLLIAVVKVNILILLLMPLLIGQAQWLPASLCGLCAVVTYPLQRILSPQLFVDYQTAASNQIVDRGIMASG
jgi:hypothetical protein